MIDRKNYQSTILFLMLPSMDDKYKFIAKDKDGSVAVFTDKPHIEENKFSTH